MGDRENLEREKLLLKIRSIMPSLSETMRRVAEYITDHSDEAMYLNITQLANKCSVSESTITKFIHTLGIGGYRNMRIALARVGKVSPIHSNTQISLSDDARTICANVFHNNQIALSESLEMLDVDAIEKVARAMLGARKIDFYGQGSACVATTNALIRLYRIGLIVNVYEDPHKQIISTSHLLPGDVAVGISNSGISAEVVRALGLAKEFGATTVCITSYENSPIAKVSDHVLLTCTKDSKELRECINARVAEITLIDALYAVIVSMLDDEMIQRLHTSSKTIRKYKYV